MAGKNKVPASHEPPPDSLAAFVFFGSFLMPGRERAMYGTNLQLFILRCRVCHRWIAVRDDPDDLRRHYGGVYVQHAFVRRDGTAYLTPAERELFLSRCCASCWPVLCSDDKLAYC